MSEYKVLEEGVLLDDWLDDNPEQPYIPKKTPSCNCNTYPDEDEHLLKDNFLGDWLDDNPEQPYIPKKTPSCNCNTCPDEDGHLLKGNYLGEFLTEADKRRARENLGLKDVGYRLEPFTTRGYEFYREGQQYNHTLSVRVFWNEKDTTESINPMRFKWIRVSENTQGDTVWNERHSLGGNSIDITSADLAGDTSFRCEFLDIENNNILTKTF